VRQILENWESKADKKEKNSLLGSAGHFHLQRLVRAFLVKDVDKFVKAGLSVLITPHRARLTSARSMVRVSLVSLCIRQARSKHTFSASINMAWSPARRRRAGVWCANRALTVVSLSGVAGSFVAQSSTDRTSVRTNSGLELASLSHWSR